MADEDVEDERERGYKNKQLERGESPCFSGALDKRILLPSSVNSPLVLRNSGLRRVPRLVVQYQGIGDTLLVST